MTQETSLAVPTSLQGGAIVEGTGGAAPFISRLTVYQGTAEEEQKYGNDFKRGQFLDVLEVKSLGDKVRVMPIAGWVSWVKFERGSRIPVYSTRNKAEVPPHDLEWHDKTPPAATECVNMVLCVQGVPFPFVFIFKRTGLKAYQQTIGPLENRRGVQKQGPGLYELTTVDDKNPDGQPYKRLTARPVGDPDAETVKLAVTVREMYGKWREEFERRSDEAQGGEDIPI